MVLWNTSPQPPGNVLETHRRAPGSARALLREGEFPRTHCRVSKRLEVDVGCPSVAALGEGSAHARPSLHLSCFASARNLPPHGGGEQRCSFWGFPSWLQAVRRGKNPKISAHKAQSLSPPKKEELLGFP